MMNYFVQWNTAVAFSRHIHCDFERIEILAQTKQINDDLIKLIKDVVIWCQSDSLLKYKVDSLFLTLNLLIISLYADKVFSHLFLFTFTQNYIHK